MLSDEQKNHILNEEIYRAEVRQQLEAKTPQPKQRKIVRFVNSNFGLFILSSVVLSFITWTYTTYSHKLDDQSADITQTKKLEYEIGYRIEVIGEMSDSCEQDDLDNIRYAIKGKQDMPNTKTIVFQSFETRSLFSLYYEYTRLTERTITPEMVAAFRSLQPLISESGMHWRNRKCGLSPGEKLTFAKTIAELRKWNR